MDFHGLARRQLQALCKLNKIPANMTNVAMADALSSLDNVEGIEEIMLQGNEESGSPEVPRTVTKTSSRARKPPVNVLASGGIVTQSRGRASRKLVNDDEDSIEDEKKDVAKTPAVASCRKRATAVASRKKIEVPSVQKVYSTRRSVRLVEKQLSELCLGESKTRTQAIAIDMELSSEMTESDVQGDSLAISSNEMSVKEAMDDEVNSKEVSTQVEGTIDETVNDTMKLETQANYLGSNLLAVADDINSEQKAELVVESSAKVLRVMEDEIVEAPASQISSAMDTSLCSLPVDDSTDDSNSQGSVKSLVLSVEQVENVKNIESAEEVVDSNVPKLVIFEKKPDAISPTLEPTSGLFKESPPGMENVDKDNGIEGILATECFEVPEKSLKDLSMRELMKMLKRTKITDTGKKVKDGDANMGKHQDTPRPARQALETLQGNTQI